MPRTSRTTLWTALFCAGLACAEDDVPEPPKPIGRPATKAPATNPEALKRATTQSTLKGTAAPPKVVDAAPTGVVPPQAPKRHETPVADKAAKQDAARAWEQARSAKEEATKSAQKPAGTISAPSPTLENARPKTKSTTNAPLMLSTEPDSADFPLPRIPQASPIRSPENLNASAPAPKTAVVPPPTLPVMLSAARPPLKSVAAIVRVVAAPAATTTKDLQVKSVSSNASLAPKLVAPVVRVVAAPAATTTKDLQGKAMNANASLAPPAAPKESQGPMVLVKSATVAPPAADATQTQKPAPQASIPSAPLRIVAAPPAPTGADQAWTEARTWNAPTADTNAEAGQNEEKDDADKAHWRSRPGPRWAQNRWPNEQPPRTSASVLSAPHRLQTEVKKAGGGEAVDLPASQPTQTTPDGRWLPVQVFHDEERETGSIPFGADSAAVKNLKQQFNARRTAAETGKTLPQVLVEEDRAPRESAPNSSRARPQFELVKPRPLQFEVIRANGENGAAAERFEPLGGKSSSVTRFDPEVILAAGDENTSPKPPVASYTVTLWTVEGWETFRSLAKQKYNDEEYATALARYNRSRKRPGQRLEPNTKVRLPPRAVLEKLPGGPPAAAAAAPDLPPDPKGKSVPLLDEPPSSRTAASSSKVTKKPPQQAARASAREFKGAEPAKSQDSAAFNDGRPGANPAPFFTVKEAKMSLYKVAVRTLGDGAMYPKIYELNRDQLSSATEELEIGTRLRLPPDAVLQR